MKNNKGFSIIEMLAAASLIAFGVVAVSKMQTSTIKISKSGQLRSDAAYLIQNIMNRMQANFIEARKGTASSYHNNNSPTDIATTDCNDSSTVCDSSQMANHDLSEWSQLVESYLGSTAVWRVCVDSTPTPNSHDITSCDGLNTSGRTVWAIKLAWYDKEDDSAQNGNLNNSLVITTEF